MANYKTAERTVEAFQFGIEQQPEWFKSKISDPEMTYFSWPTIGEYVINENLGFRIVESEQFEQQYEPL